MPFYRAALPLSRKTLNYTAGVIRRHRRQTSSRWRKLNPGQQALLAPAYLCKGETFTDLAAGAGISTATAWRYISEAVALLPARSPKLRAALRSARKAKRPFVVLDGASGTSPPPRRTPTGLTPGCALLVSAPMPSSRPGASCASSAAAPGAPGTSPKPSTSCKPAKPQDEKGHYLWDARSRSGGFGGAAAGAGAMSDGTFGSPLPIEAMEVRTESTAP
jgi:hypothetical protein